MLDKCLTKQNLKAFVGHNVYEKSLEISQEIPQYSYGELSSGDFILALEKKLTLGKAFFKAICSSAK